MNELALLPYLHCPSCHVRLDLENTYLECTNEQCSAVYRVEGEIVHFFESPGGHLKPQTGFWNFRAAYYEGMLSATSFLGDNQFSYFKAVEEVARTALEASPASPLPVLDVACGTGLVARSIASRAGEQLVVGLDYSAEMLQVARQHSKKPGLARVEYVKADAHALPFKRSSFRAVTCAGALSNMNDPQKVLDEFARVTAAGGVVSVLVTVFEKTMSMRVKLSRLMLDLTYAVQRVPLRWFPPEELRSMMQRAGYESIALKPLGGAWTLATGRL